MRVLYDDNYTARKREYIDLFRAEPYSLVSFGRFLGSVNGYWVIESEMYLIGTPKHGFEPALDSATVHFVNEKCIQDCQVLGKDDAPLPDDLEDLLKDAGGK